jgi:hypothetical protein
MRNGRGSEDLLHHAGLQLHPPKAGNGRINVVIAHAVINESDASHLRADLHHTAAGALDLEVLGDRDRVTIGEHIANGILDRSGLGRGLGRVF